MAAAEHSIVAKTYAFRYTGVTVKDDLECVRETGPSEDAGAD